jgi:hypothetical protein
MNPKKNSRRCRASVSIQALDLAISRFIHSLDYKATLTTTEVSGLASIYYIFIAVFEQPSPPPFSTGSRVENNEQRAETDR